MPVFAARADLPSVRNCGEQCTYAKQSWDIGLHVLLCSTWLKSGFVS
jgi:hypothetical protein